MKKTIPTHPLSSEGNPVPMPTVDPSKNNKPPVKMPDIPDPSEKPKRVIPEGES